MPIFTDVENLNFMFILSYEFYSHKQYESKKVFFVLLIQLLIFWRIISIYALSAKLLLTQ